MELKDVLQQMMQQSQAAMQPTDLCIGTVDAVDPLEITISTAMAPLRREVLYLTESVVEKKIPILTHSHTIPAGTLKHNHGGAVADDLTTAYQTDERLQSVACYENGQALPVEGGYIILNRALQVGDKVLLLKVQKGQKFIILSRVFEG